MWSVATSSTGRAIALGCEDGTVRLFSAGSALLSGPVYDRPLQRHRARVLSLDWLHNAHDPAVQAELAAAKLRHQQRVNAAAAAAAKKKNKTGKTGDNSSSSGDSDSGDGSSSDSEDDSEGALLRRRLAGRSAGALAGAAGRVNRGLDGGLSSGAGAGAFGSGAGSVFVADSPLLVSGGADGKVRVWHVATARCLLTMRVDALRETTRRGKGGKKGGKKGGAGYDSDDEPSEEDDGDGDEDDEEDEDDEDLADISSLPGSKSLFGDAANSDPFAAIKRLRTGRRLRHARVWAVRWVDHQTVAAGDSLGHVQLFETRFGSTVATVAKHQGDVLALAVARPGFHADLGGFSGRWAGPSLGPVIYAAGADSKVVELRPTPPAHRAVPSGPGATPALAHECKWVVGGSHRAHSHDVHALVIAPQVVVYADESATAAAALATMRQAAGSNASAKKTAKTGASSDSESGSDDDNEEEAKAQVKRSRPATAAHGQSGAVGATMVEAGARVVCEALIVSGGVDTQLAFYSASAFSALRPRKVLPIPPRPAVAVSAHTAAATATASSASSGVSALLGSANTAAEGTARALAALRSSYLMLPSNSNSSSSNNSSSSSAATAAAGAAGLFPRQPDWGPAAAAARASPAARFVALPAPARPRLLVRSAGKVLDVYAVGESAGLGEAEADAAAAAAAEEAATKVVSAADNTAGAGAGKKGGKKASAAADSDSDSDSDAGALPTLAPASSSLRRLSMAGGGGASSTAAIASSLAVAGAAMHLQPASEAATASALAAVGAAASSTGLAALSAQVWRDNIAIVWYYFRIKSLYLCEYCHLYFVAFVSNFIYLTSYYHPYLIFSFSTLLGAHPRPVGRGAAERPARRPACDGGPRARAPGVAAHRLAA